MQARCLLFEFQRRRYRAEDPSVGRNDFFNRLLASPGQKDEGPPMETEASVEIDRPIAEVFDYTIHHVTEWSATVVEDEVIEEKPEGVGTTFRCVTQDRGQRLEFAGVVTRHEPPTLSAIRLTGKFDLDVTYRFEDLGGSRTRVTQKSVIHARGLFRAFLFVFGKLIRRSSCDAQTNELESLKRKLEERASTDAP